MAILNDVVELIRPFVCDARGEIDTSMEFWAARTLHENYAELSDEEIHHLVSAAIKVIHGPKQPLHHTYLWLPLPEGRSSQDLH
jgi:hypothetical protein